MSHKNYHQRIEKIVDIMLEMTRRNSYNKLLIKLKQGALELTNNAKVEIFIIDHLTGEFKTNQSCSEMPPNENKNLKSNLGIMGLAVREETPQRADDISKPKWQKYYIELYSDTRSEIALPLVIDEVTVREKTQLSTGSKVLGVLNIESPIVNAFSEEDEQQLWLLARHAAILLDKCEYNQKINQLREIERQIVNEENYEQIMQLISRSIAQTLKFQFVNISLIEDNHIKTKYLVGLREEEEIKFKQMAHHPLDGKDIDICADIVKHKKIEVLEGYDKRLDQEIFETFGHQNFIRVFLPMTVLSSNKVLGAVEAAYPKEYRKHIYEQDVEILENFVSYAAQTLERRKLGRIARITHELKSPIIGIKSHASFMQRRWDSGKLSSNLIKNKFEDIITDCEIMLNQITKLDYFLKGIKQQKLKIEKIFIFRDIIIKTIHQLRPTIIAKGFSIFNIEYPDNCHRIEVFTDKAKINQVVYNLLINSIKYAKKDPNQFKIKIEVEDEYNQISIKFKDWGTGIGEKDKDLIFEEGFRSQDAIQSEVVGSGLGLTIARNIMRQFGGDLKLNNLSKPTEFEMILPKQSKRKRENDLVYR